MTTLKIKQLLRSGAGIEDEAIKFTNGVNVLVGRPNTGKTKWLQMLDFAFASEKQPHDVFGDDLAFKYDRIQVTAEAAGEEFVFERRWKEPGNKGKVILNEEALAPQEFGARLLARLGIPLLHYPQGNPYGARTWPELSWRGLLRHVYRQQRFWADIADNQPTSEQHACILQFLGIAEHLYSEDYGKLVSEQRQIMELRMKKEQFLEMLHEVSKDILDESDRGLALTPEAIDSAITRVRDEIEKAVTDRQEMVAALIDDVSEDEGETRGGSGSLFEQQSERLSEIRAKIDAVRDARSVLDNRLKEVHEYQENVTREIGRLERAQIAGETLARLKVTHCPACDQPIDPNSHDLHHCHVCGKAKQEGFNDGAKRIAFEMEHLNGEQQEANEMLLALREDLLSHARVEKNLVAEQRKLEALLKPVRRAAAAIMPPELAVLDTRRGELQERLAQLERIRESFARRDNLNAKIQEIEKNVAELETKVEKAATSINLDIGADWLGDGMNDYTNALNKGQPQAWPQDRINVRLTEKTFAIKVGNGRWSAKLGATLSYYFLIAYQFGLLKLIRHPQCHFPGLVILDFPAVLEDGSSVHDKENFVVEPFVELLARPEFADAQLIVAGASFENLEGANRIELDRVWTEGGEVEIEEREEVEPPSE